MNMARFGKPKAGGFMDVIRCDEPSYLIWKWHPEGSEAGNNSRENAIRWGSSLRVKDGEVAVFVCKQDSSENTDYIVGPFDQKIETKNFPVLARIVGLAYHGDSPFQAEVYFINLAKVIQVPFAVPFFDVYDPRFADFGVPIAVRGIISFCITDYREFISLHRLISFELNAFQMQIRAAVAKYTKEVVANICAEKNIPIVQIERQIGPVNAVVEVAVKDRLHSDFGVSVTGVDISAIELDKSSDGYRNLMAVTKDVTAATVQAQAVADIKNIHDMQRINAENMQEVLRVQREEGQYATHKQTQTANLGAYQIEAQTQVGIAGAHALGQMGSNGVGNMTGGGGGFNPVEMMAGLAVGGVMGQNIAGTMQHILSGVNQPQPANPQPAQNQGMSLSEQVNAVKQLKELLDAGILSQDEFDVKKKEVMGL